MGIPQLGISPLSKSLIQIRGPDATRFLNGLITSRLLPNVIKKKQHTISEAENRHAELGNIIDLDKNWGLMHEDIYDPDQNILIRRDGINSMFLNSKGRIVNDCFLYTNPFHNTDDSFNQDISEPNFLVEIDSMFTSQLQMLLRLHKLSSRIKFTQRKDLFTYYYYNDTAEFDEWLDNLQFEHFNSFNPTDALQNANSFIKRQIMFNAKYATNIVGFAIDNRIPNFGVKIITNKELTLEDQTHDDSNKIPLSHFFSEAFTSAFPIQITSEDFVTKRRYLNGLFETGDAPKGTSLLPFETNLDYTNGLSLDKGCYVGQELTIRTFNNGIIRKRVVPVQFFTIAEETVSQLHHQEYAMADSGDPVVDDLRNINSASISNLEVNTLATEESSQPTPDTAANSTNNPFASKSTSSPFGSKPVRKRKTSKGKILSIVDNLGFMLMNVDDLNKNSLYEVEIPCLEQGNGVKKIGIKAYRPDWWAEEDAE